MKQPSLFEQAKQVFGYNANNLLRCADLAAPNPEDLTSISEWLALEKARRLQAHYVYFRRFDDRPSQPLFYVYEYTHDTGLPDERYLGGIQKDIWSSGEVPCALVFTKSTIRIINTSQQPVVDGDGFIPTDLIGLTNEISQDLKQRFSAFRLDSGEFWHEEHDHFHFDKSAHQKLLAKLRKVRSAFLDKKILPPELVNKLLIQCVLIRYLEEKEEVDAVGALHKVFPDGFFQEVAQASSFQDALAKGTFLLVFDKLNDKEHLNGKIFELSNAEKQQLLGIPTDKLSNLLYQPDTDAGGQKAFWDLYSFRYLPVEVVSSIYEALFTTTTEVKENGMVYTPPHLAAFLIDEAMPLNAWKGKIDYKICDPSCGSGVFLVLAFRRLVHWWRLQNKGMHPRADDLMRLLQNNLWGIDREESAVLLTRFSLCLAVCDILTPPEIWDQFHFPNLESQLVAKDFFTWQQANNNKVAFDLIIGNPPFKQAHTNLPDWKKISEYPIPQKQIALYFLSASMGLVRPGGLLCLLMKSSSLLYTTTGNDFRTRFFAKHKVHQVIDFTLLARNRVLWPTAEPDTAAVFISQEAPDIQNDRVLHVVIKRTPATKMKRVFEVDAYDFHWVSYAVALQDDFVWKCNLVGGSRVYGLAKYLKNYPTLGGLIKIKRKEGWVCSVGYRTSENEQDPKSEDITDKPMLPTEWLTEDGITSFDFPTERAKHFKVVRDTRIYQAPHIVMKANIGDERSIPMWYFQTLNIGFKDGIIGLSAPQKDTLKVESLYKILKKYNDLHRVFLFATSPKCLVYKNTVILVEDLYTLPLPNDLDTLAGTIDVNPKMIPVLNDVLEHYQNFIRRPEDLRAFNPVASRNFHAHFTRFGTIFCESLNAVYAQNGLQFRQAEAGYINGKDFVFMAFRYDSQPPQPIPEFGADATDLSSVQLQNLLTLESGPVRFRRILKFYKKDYVCFIKPNQFRYWLDSIALRDADGVLADLVANGQ